MGGHQLRVGALAWSSTMLSSGSGDETILQRDVRTREDFVSKLSGHKSEVRLISLSFSSFCYFKAHCPFFFFLSLFFFFV